MLFFFFNDTATTEIYTLSLHDALPICDVERVAHHLRQVEGHHGLVATDAGELLQPAHGLRAVQRRALDDADRKSTRLNSSHSQISYAVFCLKKKKTHMSSTRCTPISTH